MNGAKWDLSATVVLGRAMPEPLRERQRDASVKKPAWVPHWGHAGLFSRGDAGSAAPYLAQRLLRAFCSIERAI